MRMPHLALAFLLPMLTAGMVRGQGAVKNPPGKDFSGVKEVEGKTLEQWIKEIPSKDPSKRGTAIRAVLVFGPDRAYAAIPEILKETGKHRPPSYPVDAGVCVIGAMAMGIILSETKDPEPKYVSEAVRILTRFLEDRQAIIRYRAVEALGRLGTDAKDSINKVLPLVRDPSTWETRQAACIALGKIAVDNEKGPPPVVLSTLYVGLKDSSLHVRLSAIQALTWLGAPANPTAQIQLIRALEPLATKDEEPTVQIWAHMAIMSIQHQVPDDRVDLIVKHMGSEEAAVRMRSVQAVGTIGPKAKRAIPGLERLLTDRVPEVVSQAIWALTRMEENAERSVPMLQRVAADPDQLDPIKEQAAEAVKQIKNGKKKKK